jgi:hypothetical protein
MQGFGCQEHTFSWPGHGRSHWLSHSSPCQAFARHPWQSSLWCIIECIKAWKWIHLNAGLTHFNIVQSECIQWFRNFVLIAGAGSSVAGLRLVGISHQDSRPKSWWGRDSRRHMRMALPWFNVLALTCWKKSSISAQISGRTLAPGEDRPRRSPRLPPLLPMPAATQRSIPRLLRCMHGIPVAAAGGCG